jgi:ABC-type Fe3+/spermidine/putrescine transport system ATPase subunit
VDALSGGEQQRVALARTLAPAPRLLMLDDPLANLDRLLREELVDELRTILKRIGVTTIFVTHDQAEAFALADHVVVMRAGEIEQEGSPQAVHRSPANAFVAAFLGFRNLLEGTALRDASALSGWAAETTLGRLPLAEPPAPELLDLPYYVLIRPDAASLEPRTEPGATQLVGAVTAASFRGGVYRLQIAPQQAPAATLVFDLPTRGDSPLPRAGDRVQLHLDTHGVLLVRESEPRFAG